jgi:hypothetical protein
MIRADKLRNKRYYDAFLPFVLRSPWTAFRRVDGWLAGKLGFSPGLVCSRSNRASATAASQSACALASKPSLGKPWEGIVFAYGSGPIGLAILAASAPWLVTRWWETIGGQWCDRDNCFAAL